MAWRARRVATPVALWEGMGWQIMAKMPMPPQSGMVRAAQPTSHEAASLPSLFKYTTKHA